MPAVIGLDIGTSKLGAVALSAERLCPLAVRTIANDADVPGLPPDAHEQDPNWIMSRCVSLLKDLLTDPAISARDVAGIGISGQMHGVLLVDGRLRPASNLVTWRDRRAAPALPEIRAVLGSDALRRAGCLVDAGFGGVTLHRFARDGDLRGLKALGIADFIAATLTGAVATERTLAASWGIMDICGGEWDETAIGALGIPPEVLLPVDEPCAPLGDLAAEARDVLGLERTVRVCSPIGDNQASVIGSIGFSSDAFVVNLGTGGQVSVPTAEFATVEGLETRPMPHGGWLLVGASLCGGWAYAYLMRFYKEVAREIAGVEIADAEVYARMNGLAKSAAAGGITADTRFAGTRLDPSARGGFAGVDRDNLTPGNLARAVVGGMIEELAALARPAGLAPMKRAVASGNGARRIPAIVETIAGRFGVPCAVSAFDEEAAVGAAFAAAVGLGIVSKDAPFPDRGGSS